MDAPRGPYLIYACLCEKVLQEKDGVLSLIRVVDRIMHREVGPDAPAEMPEVRFPLELAISLKPGSALGRHEVALRLVSPSGRITDIARLPVHFDGGEDRGVNLRVDLQARYQSEGLYWFELYWDTVDNNSLMTRVPLRLVYERMLSARKPA